MLCTNCTAALYLPAHIAQLRPAAFFPSVFVTAAAMARMSFICQLECAGGLWHWAVYAALHIPNATERSKVCACRAATRKGGRSSLVRAHPLGGWPLGG